MATEKLFNLIATAIILQEPFKKDVSPKYFICKRSDKEETFPGKWTVPGGHLETTDFINTPRETKDYWYNVIEKALKREVKEECNLDIRNIWYLTSLARVKKDGIGSMVLSFVADYAGGEVKLDEWMDDSAWVTYEEAKNYDLLDGILDELWIAERRLAGEVDVEWQRAS